MITKEAIEAAAAEIQMLHGAGATVSEQAERILTAAFAAMPAVRVPTGEAYRDLMDMAFAVYEANTPPSYRYSAIALTKAVEAAISVLTPGQLHLGPAGPEEIAAAWSAWHSRHGGKLGSGPAFVEAINAAFEARRKKVMAR